MDLALITPLILTYNEAPNIGRTLSALNWAKEIVVVDSFSTDETLEILQSYAQVTLWQREFESFAEQCNYGLSKIETEWVLSLDADYIITPSLLEVIKKETINRQVNAYRVAFKYCIFGKPLRGTLLPPRTVLYRVDQASYENDGHGHRVRVNGICQQLDGYLYHDDRKPLNRWLWAQDRYMKLETEKILNTPFSQLSTSDKIRTTKVLAPPIVFLYCLIFKQGILDSWQGWYYAWQRTLAEILLAIHLIEAEKLKNNE